MPGDVCLGIGSEWSRRGCRGITTVPPTLVCGKVRHLGCLVAVRGSWVFWLGEKPAVRVEGCEMVKQILYFVVMTREVHFHWVWLAR